MPNDLNKEPLNRILSPTKLFFSSTENTDQKAIHSRHTIYILYIYGRKLKLFKFETSIHLIILAHLFIDIQNVIIHNNDMHALVPACAKRA